MIEAVEDLLNYLHDWLDSTKETLEIEYVAYGDDELIPEYPAIIVSGGPTTRDTQVNKFRTFLDADIWILHANLNENIRTRTRRDMELATNVRKLLHSDMKLSGNIVQGWVRSEIPGTVIASGVKIVASRLSYTAEIREIFVR